MAKLKQITISLSVTKNLGNFNNIKPGVEEVWEVSDDEQSRIEEIRSAIWSGLERQLEKQLDGH